MRRLDDWLGRPPRLEGDRPTRFHTQRGRLIPLREWPRAARPLLAELTGRPPPRPWLAPGAVRWLRRTIEPSWSVLELGAGLSTPWLARRAAEVTSFETQVEWHQEVARRLDSQGDRNVQLRLCPLKELGERIRDLAERYDLVLIDFKEWGVTSRVDSVAIARSKVKPGRYLLLDNSDRPRYQPADELLAGWEVRRFAGMTYGPFAAIETAVYRRPGAAK